MLPSAVLDEDEIGEWIVAEISATGPLLGVDLRTTGCIGRKHGPRKQRLAQALQKAEVAHARTIPNPTFCASQPARRVEEGDTVLF